MLNLIEKIKVFIMVRIIWNVFPSKKLEMIRQYEATEDDSAWQLLYGMKQIDDPGQKAELFTQALEEAHHAELFRELYKKETKQKLHKVSYEKKPLYAQKKHAWKLFVYCLIGEESAAKRFDHIANHLPQGAMRSTLQGIVADEIGHIHKAKELINVEGIAQDKIAKEINQINLRRFKEAWMRSGRHITTWITDMLLLCLYFILVPFFAVMKNRSLT